MSSLSVRWPDAITMFEAFSSDNAFRLMNRYKTRYCTLNDDISSTASVVLASLLTSCRIKGTSLSDETLLLYGSGNSGCGIATLIARQLEADGLSAAKAHSRIWMVHRPHPFSSPWFISLACACCPVVDVCDCVQMDSCGLLVSTRSDIAEIAPQKLPFVRHADPGNPPSTGPAQNMIAHFAHSVDAIRSCRGA